MSVFVDREKCEGCGICVSVCPVQAITVIENKALIDQNRCSECLLCRDECPNHAIYQISEEEVSLEKRDHSIPSLVNKDIPQPKQIFSTNKRKQQAVKKEEVFFDKFRKVMGSLFAFDSPWSSSGKGRQKKYRRQRGRHRRGRF
jgi:formate hydrogenlyase subunit 6/NADH:ubiquinone oxidoreductase subunit I